MKLKKLIVPFLAVCTAVTASAGLAACGNGDADKDKDKDKDTRTTITYQFTGEFTNATLSGYGFDYYIMLNLNSDGKVKGSGYNCLSMDNRAADKNSGFGEKWFRGTWEEAKDEEDQDCVKITAIYDSDAKNSMTGTTLTNTSTYYVVKKADGSLSDFRLQSPIFSGTTEYMTQMKQNKTPYDTADKFIQANLYTWTAPTGYEAVFETTSESQMTGKIYLMPEGVADVYSGKQVPETTEYKFMKGESWQWSYSGGTLKVGEYTATVTGTTATLEYTKNAMGHDMPYKYACSDISKLTETAPVVPDLPTAIVTFTAQGATLEFYADHTAKLSAYGGMLKPEFTWAVADGVITLTDKENASKTYTSVTADGATKITYSDSLAGNPVSIELTCNDISAILSVEPVAVFTDASGATLSFFADHTAKASFFSGAMNINFTWTLQNGTVTLTDAVNTSKVYASTVSGQTTSLTIKDGYANGTFTIDVSKLG